MHRRQQKDRERGQAVLLMVLIMSIVLLGALGITIDIAQDFAHQQMAQVAADAAAQAAMLSVFQGVNNATDSPATYFPTTAFDCNGNANTTPCKYASMNGWGFTGTDTVKVAFPACPAPSCSTAIGPNAIQVTVTRTVPNSFLRLINNNLTGTKIQATAVAATLTAGVGPVAVLVLHPTMEGSLTGDSNSNIIITGGPSRSIQVNSSNTQAYGGNNKGINIDLSRAGPKGSGGNFGVFGGPSYSQAPGVFDFGTLPGKYLQPASPMKDPLLFVCAPGDNVCLAGEGLPSDPPILTAPAVQSISIGSTPNYGCSDSNGCVLYQPGLYPGGISLSAKHAAIFQPGVYVMGGGNGFSVSSNGTAQMCVVNALPNWPAVGAGCVADPVTGDGMLVYNKDGGIFSITQTKNGCGYGASCAVQLKSTPETSRYAGILFFQDRTSPATANKPHNLGGGCLDLIGTIYTTNTLVTMKENASHFQEIVYHGSPCSSTARFGQIITDVLTLKGGPTINMLVSSDAYLKADQVALVQ